MQNKKGKDFRLFLKIKQIEIVFYKQRGGVDFYVSKVELNIMLLYIFIFVRNSKDIN